MGSDAVHVDWICFTTLLPVQGFEDRVGEQAVSAIALICGLSRRCCRDDVASRGIFELGHDRLALAVAAAEGLARSGLAGIENDQAFLRRDLGHPGLPLVLADAV